MTLLELGWHPQWAPWTTRASQSPDHLPGRVVGESRQAYTVVTEQGPFTALLPGRILKLRSDPLTQPKVGDWVLVSPQPHEDKAVIESILPRQSLLVRKVTGRHSSHQVLATNVDVAFITQSLEQPLNLRRIERFLVMVHQGGVRPVILLNKSDRVNRIRDLVAQVQEIAPDIPVLSISALKETGFQSLRKHLIPRETCVFLGTSGVGKSTLINRLYGEEIQKTIEVRERDAKGRHATTHRELIPLPNGSLVIDTPGMREFHLWEADAGLMDAFPDIESLAAGCRFRDCRHQDEIGCALQAAVTQGRLPSVRLASYHKLQKEMGEVTRRQQELRRSLPSPSHAPSRQAPLRSTRRFSHPSTLSDPDDDEWEA